MTLSFQDMLKPTKKAPSTDVQLLIATTLHGPRRVGEWTPAEIDYAYHKSNAFKLDLFDDGIPQRKSVRLWLATLLNCSPMRLSKKFDTESNLLGKCFFNKNVAALAVMSPEERTYRYNAMEAARMRFMESIGRSPCRGYHRHIVESTRPSLGLRRPRAPDLSAVAKTVESPRSVYDSVCDKGQQQLEIEHIAVQFKSTDKYTRCLPVKSLTSVLVKEGKKKTSKTAYEFIESQPKIAKFVLMSSVPFVLMSSGPFDMSTNFAIFG